MGERLYFGDRVETRAVDSEALHSYFPNSIIHRKQLPTNGFRRNVLSCAFFFGSL
jgi:hypothetical protein